MPQIFTPEHYRTAEQFGVEGFADAWGMTSAEIALTLTRLNDANVLSGMSMDDLQGYHFMHYSADFEIVKESAEWILDKNEWNEEKVPGTKQRLEEVLQRGKMLAPIELGRIAVGHAELDTDFEDITKPLDLPEGAPGVQRIERFVTPIKGLTAFFVGRTTLDLFQASSSKYIKQGGSYNELLESMKVHNDYLLLKNNEGQQFSFVAQSYTEGWKTKIATVTALPSLHQY